MQVNTSKKTTIMLFVLKNKDGLYWGMENDFTPYINCAKAYDLVGAKKGAQRRNCMIHKADMKPSEDGKGYWTIDCGVFKV